MILPQDAVYYCKYNWIEHTTDEERCLPVYMILMGC